MRALRLVFVLAFGLAMVGPEAHHCPVHDQHAPAAPAHHQQSADHQQTSQTSHKLCTCPQACCPVTVIAVPEPAAWAPTTPLTRLSAQSHAVAVILTARKHLQPPAQAPPAPISRV